MVNITAKEEKKEAIKQAGMLLTDDELDKVALSDDDMEKVAGGDHGSYWMDIKV